MAIDNAKILSIVKRKPQIRILSDEEVEWFISSAIRKYISTKYPFSSTFKDVDELVGNEIKILENWVISATIAMIESMGIGIIQSYSENGLSVKYATMIEGIPESLLDEIVPSAGVS